MTAPSLIYEESTKGIEDAEERIEGRDEPVQVTKRRLRL